jgi:hypothetical protein
VVLPPASSALSAFQDIVVTSYVLSGGSHYTLGVQRSIFRPARNRIMRGPSVVSMSGRSEYFGVGNLAFLGVAHARWLQDVLRKGHLADGKALAIQ